MSEPLLIEVDVPTSQAVAQLQNLVQGLDNVGTSVAKTDEKLKEAEGDLQQLGSAAVKTGEDMTKMGKATDDAAKHATTAAENLEKVGVKATEAGDKMKTAGEKGEKALKPLPEATGAVGQATDGLIEKVTRLGGAYLTLHTVIDILKELETRTKAVVDAQQLLAREKLDLDTQLQPLLMNLGMADNQANQDKVRGLAQTFQRQVGNKDSGLTREILSAFANNGFNVEDSGGEGFKMAVATGQWAQRTGLSGDAAKEMARTANLSGAKSAADVERLIAQHEAGFAGTSIPHSTEYQQAAIRAESSALTQGVPVSQSLGLLAASAVGNPEASVAASRLAEYNAALSPSETQFRGRLGMLAQKQGVIGDDDIKWGEQRFRQLHPNYDRDRAKTIQIEQDRANSARERYEDLKTSQPTAIADAHTALADEQQAITDEEASIAAAGRGKGRRGEDPSKKAADVARRKDALQKRRDALKAKTDQVEKMEREAPDKLERARRIASDAQLRVSTTAEDEEHKLHMEALGHALERVPLAKMQMVPFTATDGKSAEEQRQILGEFMPPSMVQNLIPMFGAGPRQQMKSVMESAAKATAQQTRDRNAAYLTTTLSDAARQQAESQQANVGAVGPGQEFATGLLDQATERMKREQSQGRASVGFWASNARGMKDAFASDETTRANLWADRPASSTEGQQALQASVLLNQQMQDFQQSLTPEQLARHPELASVYQGISRDILKTRDDATGPMMGARALERMQQAAARFGALRAAIRSEASQNGEAIPTGGDLGGGRLPLPAGAVSTGPLGPAAPVAHTGTINGVPTGQVVHQTNVHIGNHFAGGASADDLPGRLEGH